MEDHASDQHRPSFRQVDPLNWSTKIGAVNPRRVVGGSGSQTARLPNQSLPKPGNRNFRLIILLVGMRRVYAILLVCVIGWPMLWPMLAQGSSVVPHACCFRGRHSCCDSTRVGFEAPQNHDCCRTVRTVTRVSFELGQLLVAPTTVQPVAAAESYAPPQLSPQSLLPVRAPPSF
jgi:hypothetical protein